MLAYESIDASIIQDSESPWVPFTPYSDAIHLKYFKLDPVHGEVVALLKVPPNIVMPSHYHGGSVIVYTLKGSWSYLEHDWLAEEGSLIYETTASVHTPRSYDAGAVTLNILRGDSEYRDGNGEKIATENWHTHLARYLDYCKATGLRPRDLTSFNRT